MISCTVTSQKGVKIGYIDTEYILENLNFMDDEDLIFFSDPDEIPNPNVLANFILKNDLLFYYLNYVFLNLLMN